MADTVRIVALADRPDLVPGLARHFVAEWTPHYGPNGSGDAMADLTACRNRDTLPLALVAIGADGEALGTAALKQDSVGSRPGQGPWLAALLVIPQQRGRGVGTRLIAAIEDEARRLGFDALYTSTDAARDLLRRRGWMALHDVPSLRGPMTVCRLDLNRQ